MTGIGGTPAKSEIIREIIIAAGSNFEFYNTFVIKEDAISLFSLSLLDFGITVAIWCKYFILN